MPDFEKWVLDRWAGPVTLPYLTQPQMYRACPEPWRTLFIVTMGFSGERGEVVEHVKKLVRDGKLDREALLLELGDAHHYTVKLANLFGFTMAEVEQANVRKLEARDAKERQDEARTDR